MGRALVRDAAAPESLLSRLEGGERFGQAQLVNLLRQLIEELDEAHRRGRIHGTITPADILFDAAGEVSLAGFGRDTTPDPVREKPYAPVELYVPVHPQGPWTDVYSLGAVLWHAVTGAPPAEVLLRKGDATLEALAPAGFDPDFLRAVDAAMTIAPQRRPQTLAAWLAMFPAPPGATVSRLSAPAAAPSFPLHLEAQFYVPARPEIRRGPLFTIATVDGVAAYDLPVVERTDAPEPEAAPPKAAPPPAPVAVAVAPPVAPTRRWGRYAAVAAGVALAGGIALLAERPAPPPAPASVPVAKIPAPLAPEASRPEVLPAQPTPTTVEPPTASKPSIPEGIAVAPAPAPAVKPTVSKSSATKPAAKAPPPAPVGTAEVERQPSARPIEEPAPGLEGATPRMLLARADRRLRDLFGDYDRLRSAVSRSYGSRRLSQAAKERAYDASMRLHDDLLDLRRLRNKLARTDNARLANRRYDEFERSAARIDARMADVRRSI